MEEKLVEVTLAGETLVPTPSCRYLARVLYDIVVIFILLIFYYNNNFEYV